MVLRLWVPLIHSLVARNWNLASPGLALTASSVANTVGVSTPLSGGRILLLVVVIAISPIRCRATSDAWHNTGDGNATTLEGGLSPDVPAMFPGSSRSRRSLGESAPNRFGARVAEL